MGVGALLAANGLTVVLPGDAGYVSILDGVSLQVEPGEIVDVLGASGSGKTTLLRVLARVLPGATGELALEGTPSRAIDAASWRKKVALVPQKPALADASIRENLLLPWRLSARRRETPPADETLSDGLARLGVEASLDRPVSRLSVGQVARVAFLRTLLTSPRVLLLDEPDAALDDASAEALASLVKDFAEQGNAVVRARHGRSDGRGARQVRITGGRLLGEGLS